MARDLKGIIRYRKWELDEKRRALGELLRQEEGLIDTLRQCDEEMVQQMQAVSGQMAVFGLNFANYSIAAKARKEQIQQWLHQTRARIEAARDDLSQSFKELKTFEIAQEKRELLEKQELALKQQKTLDDIGLTIHRRRKTNEENR